MVGCSEGVVRLICWEDNTNLPQIHPMVTTSIPLEL